MSRAEMITLSIDGKKAKVEPGTTILEAARSIGISIPIICLHEVTTAEGICRQCVVEVEGWGRLAPACITPAADGLNVKTASERVIRARRTLLEMLSASVDISQSPELQRQMDLYNADPGRFPGAKNGRRSF